MPENRKPILDPRRELPAPHDMSLDPGPKVSGELEAGYSDLLPAGPKNVKHPHVSGGHHVPSWFIIGVVVIILLLILAVGGMYVSNQNNTAHTQTELTSSTEPTATPFPTPTITFTPTASAAAYSFQSLTFEIPENWYISESEMYFTAQNYDPRTTPGRGYSPTLDKGKLKLFIRTIQGVSSLTSYAKQTAEGLPGAGDRWKQVATTFAGQTAIKITDEQSDQPFLFITKDPQTNIVYEISFDLDIKTNQNQIKNLLSTFTFPDNPLIPSANISQAIKGCTKELKICPDGTKVGRTGPNCKFAKCPKN